LNPGPTGGSKSGSSSKPGFRSSGTPQSTQFSFGPTRTVSDELEKRLAHDFEVLKGEISNIKIAVNKLTLENSHLKGKIKRMEDQSRRQNLIFYGIDEGETESWAETEQKVKTICEGTLEIGAPLIDRAHRLGKPTRMRDDEPRDRQETSTSEPGTYAGNNNNGRPKQNSRPVIVNFTTWKEKEEVLRAARACFKGQRTPFRVVEDYSEETRSVRRRLIAFIDKVKSDQPDARVFLRYDKLVINGKMFELNDDMSDIQSVKRQTEHKPVK
jgi:hypothetical protein